MTETINCPRCGTNHSFAARFCSVCGASLIPATGPTTRLVEKRCPSCHTLVPENAQFCAECGQQVSGESTLLGWGSPKDEPMLCPACRNISLLMAERHGIEVDYCPSCRGVWLDRGELDKIIERVAQTQARSPRSPAQRHDRPSSAYPTHHDDDDYRWKKKRRGFLDELFDFD